MTRAPRALLVAQRWSFACDLLRNRPGWVLPKRNGLPFYSPSGERVVWIVSPMDMQGWDRGTRIYVSPDAPSLRSWMKILELIAVRELERVDL